MMGLAVKLILGRFVNAVKWLFANPIILTIFGMAILALLWQSAKGDARHWRKMHQGQVDARAQDRATYVNAQIEAAKINAQYVATVEAEYAQNSKLAKVQYEKLSVVYRGAVADFVRKSDQAARSSSDTGRMPESAALSGTALSTSSETVVSNAVVVPVRDLELTAEAFARLEALQQERLRLVR